MTTPKINSPFFSNFSDEKEEDIVQDSTHEEEESEKQNIEEEDDDNDGTNSDNDTEDQDGESDEVEDDDKEDDTDFFTEIINDQADKGTLFYDPEKEYEGSGEEIFDEVISDTLEKRWEEEYVSQIPEEYHSIFEHLRQGKSLTEWVDAIKPTDYSKIDLEDEDNQKSLIEEHLALTGMDEDDIKDALQEYEDGGTLEKNAKKALKYLQKNEEKKAEKYEAELEASRKEIEEAQEREFEKFKTRVLATEKLGKKSLDKKEREKLLDHITKPVNKKGQSQFVLNQSDIDKQLQLAYLDMIGFDFSKLEQEATTKAASGLRAKLSKTTDLNAKGKGARGRESTESKKIGNWNPW